MPLRLQFSSSASGPANHTFQVNPSEIDPTDEANISEFPTLHGSSIYQRKSFDGRPRTFLWQGYDVSNVAIDDVVDYCRSIEGKIRWLNFQDLVPMVQRWPSLATWNKIRIVQIRISYRPGGRLRYDKIELVVIPIL